jgi:hypothetical protein
MTAQKSKKRSPEETRSRQRVQKERGEQRQQREHRCMQANVQARKFKDREIADMRARHERGEVYRTIGKAYGLDEFTVARVIRHGRLTPWQNAEARRSAARKPLQDDWAKRHPQGKDTAS